MKKSYIVAIIVVLVIILGLVFLLPKKDNGSKEEKKPEKNSSTKYEIDEYTSGNLTVSNIKIETFEDYTLVSFEITNNSTEIYPEGNMNFTIKESEVELTTVSSYVSQIAPESSVEVELVLNDIYKEINAIIITND